MSAHSVLAAGVGVLVLVVGVTVGGLGFYLAWTDPLCPDSPADEPGDGTPTPGGATPAEGTPMTGGDDDGTCLPLYSWLAIGGGGLSVVGFLSLLYAWFQYAYA